MRVLYVYPIMVELGGAERVFIQKMNLLATRSGYEVFFVTYNQGSHPLSFALDEKVHHEDLGVFTYTHYQYKGLRRLWEYVKRRRMLRQRLTAKVKELQPDIIITSTAGDFPLLCQCKGKQSSVIVESHACYHHLVDYGAMTIWNRIDLFRRYQWLRKVDRIVTLTDADARRWKKHYQQVVVIPNIVHLNTTGRYSSQDEKRIIYAGRFAEVKGMTELAATWELIYQKHPDWRLDAYGNGDDRELQGVEGLHVHSAVPDPMPYYCDSSMLLLTSRDEPFGLVMPEAMSCGLPVVAFDTDGSSSIITDGEDGFVVKSSNCEAFARQVCRLIEDVELRKRMGQCAIANARRFSAENILSQWETLFKSLVAAK